MSNPQPFRTSRTPRLALAAAAALLFAVVVLLLGPAPRPAEAICPDSPCINLPPLVGTDNPSLVVDEGQTAINTGTFEAGEDDGTDDTVRISASVGTVTQSGTGFGTWSWSLATTEVSADETKTVTITATDSRGASSRTSFSLTVKDVPSPQAPPPANDNFANAQSISGSTVSVNGTTEGATAEGGEPAPAPYGADPGPGTHSVWYRWTAPTSGATTIDTCQANIDSILSVYTGSGFASSVPYEDRLKTVVRNNNDHAYCPSDSWGSKVTFDAQAGTTYHISVGDAGALQQSTFTLKLSAPRDTQAPRVTSTVPTANATGVAPSTNLTATFSEKMDIASITKSTFKLFKVTSSGTTQVTNVTVSPSTDGLKATLDPFGTSTILLAKNTKYKAAITTGTKDVAGNQLDQNPNTTGLQSKQWVFTIRT